MAPSFYETTKLDAEKDISSLLAELEHNKFMIDLEQPLPPMEMFEEEKIFCIECVQYKLRKEFQKVFARGEGICKLCWNCEE